ncbi:hypothetical protein KY290_005340 [Solanum tuberosum]|uniref:Uncharacterized protein n=1 Tax=Solanum tuberosum TaxID=4113 RepID=A0ABQ7WDV1_SOLTU|nr:hypothetical protein KY289_006926 [Solanum tuberosum]KAH0778913.1 hypothetical protein KY290_005340 [Solanum tuberosum]
MGLNDGYSQPRSQILMMIPTPTLNQVYAMIIQDESQKHIASCSHGGGDVLEPTALFTQGGSGGGHRPPQGHRRGYHAVFCDFCNMKGLSREQCFKLLTCDYCNMK